MGLVLAIGDIHTKKWIIDKVEARIKDYDRVVFCGDYADNWGASAEDSIGTWQRLWELSKAYPGKVVAVQGNHDYIYVNKTPTKQTGYNHATELLINAPEHKKLKSWLSSLPIIAEIDGVTYSHAGLDESWAGKEMWQDNSPIWVRPDNAQYKPIPQVVGHTPQQTTTEVQSGIWCIDTFSTYPYGPPIGDQSVLEVVDGKVLRKVWL